jgi:hypothetical protein
MNSKHHYTKFINVSQLQGAQCFHLDGLKLQVHVRTVLGLLDPHDEGSALQNISIYQSTPCIISEDLNSHQHHCNNLTPNTEHTSCSEANSSSASQQFSVFCGNSQMNPVQSRTLILPPQAWDPATDVLLVLTHSTVSQSSQGAMCAVNKEADGLITTEQPLNTACRGNMTEKCHVWFNLCNIHIHAVSPRG